jgi:hypothetical protein
LKLQVMFEKYEHRIVPIGSMVLVYMPTWMGYIDGIHVTIYGIHGSYGVWMAPSYKLAEKITSWIFLQFVKFAYHKPFREFGVDCKHQLSYHLVAPHCSNGWMAWSMVNYTIIGYCNFPVLKLWFLSSFSRANCFLWSYPHIFMILYTWNFIWFSMSNGMGNWKHTW